MKKIILVLFFNLWSCVVWSASTEEVIKQVQSTYDKAADVSSEFVQKVKIKSLEREVEKSGKALFKKPGKLRVEYDGEEGRLYISDGKKMWVYEKGDTQVQVFNVDAQTIPEEALTFLGGLGNLRAQFRVSGLSDNEKKSITANPNLDWLLLIPKNAQSQMEELLMGFDKQAHTVSEAYMKNESGNVSHYFFKNVQLNSSLPDSQFSFEKPKGVKEIKN